MTRTHLLLVDSSRSFGRATVGAELGRTLVEQGDRVHVLACIDDDRVFTSAGLTIEPLPNLPGLLLSLFLDDLVGRFRLASIVLCDCHSVLQLLSRRGLDATVLTRYGIPVIGVDTWISGQSGSTIDLFAESTFYLPPWPNDVKPLRTVPIARLTEGDELCQMLPRGTRLPTAQRAAVRNAHGRSGPTVMLATAPWQHALFDDSDCTLVQRIVPEQIARCVAAVPGLRLDHIGPRALPVEGILGLRYRWLGTLGPDAFGSAVASADIVITLSPVAATVAQALAAGVPVIWIRNSSLQWVSDLDSSLCQNVERATGRKRIYPFSIWPLGYHAFLEPVLKGNSILDALVPVEIADTPHLTETLAALTVDGSERHTTIEKQSHYLNMVLKLPTPGELIARWCSEA
jgi:hypothetical protein